MPACAGMTHENMARSAQKGRRRIACRPFSPLPPWAVVPEHSQWCGAEGEAARAIACSSAWAEKGLNKAMPPSTGS